MKIGIIGAGQIGGTLTRRLTALGHEVFVANSRGPRDAGRACCGDRRGRRPGPRSGARRGPGHRDHSREERPGPAGRTVRGGRPAGGRRGHRQLLPAAARRPHRSDRGGHAREPLGRAAAGPARGQGVQQHLCSTPAGAGPACGHARANRPAGRRRRRRAKAVVLRLVDELGFDGVDAGGLDESWRQQPGTPVYTTDLDAEGVRRALAAAKPERTPAWRGT